MSVKNIVLLALIVLSFPVSAEEDLRALIKAMSVQMTELSDQVKQSNRRIAELEAKLAQSEQKQALAGAAAPTSLPPSATTTPVAAGTPTASTVEGKTKTAPAVAVGDTKGTFKIPGTDSSLGFGGYVKGDVNYSSIGMGGDKIGDQHLVIAQIPVGNNRLGEDSKTTFHAKESRFWLKSFTPSAWGDINTFLEVDFLGAQEVSNYTPRLRHAYGSIGNFTAGFTWTTFLNVAAIPETLDPTGPTGDLLNLRQPVVRWTQPFSVVDTPFEFQVAAESPKSRLWAAPSLKESTDAFNFTNPNDDRYPDLVARLNYNPDWGSLSIAAMGRQIRYTKQGAGREQAAWGSAVSLAGKINTFGLDNVKFMLGYGDAYGRYAAFNAFEDAALDASGQLHLVNVYSATLAFQHWWDKEWRSTLAYGYMAADQPAFVQQAVNLGTNIPVEMTKHGQSAHINLLWSPWLTTTFGLEYFYALRERTDGQTGDLHRIQFSSRFNF
ncbi:MAG: DcaP family trimeric outer membrane transporter [Methylomonas sp.]